MHKLKLRSSPATHATLLGHISAPRVRPRAGRHIGCNARTNAMCGGYTGPPCIRSLLTWIGRHPPEAADSDSPPVGPYYVPAVSR